MTECVVPEPAPTRCRSQTSAPSHDPEQGGFLRKSDRDRRRGLPRCIPPRRERTVPLECEIPFTISADVPEADEETDLIASLELEEVEIRLLNPRKILPGWS